MPNNKQKKTTAQAEQAVQTATEVADNPVVQAGADAAVPGAGAALAAGAKVAKAAEKNADADAKTDADAIQAPVYGGSNDDEKKAEDDGKEAKEGAAPQPLSGGEKEEEKESRVDSMADLMKKSTTESFKNTKEFVGKAYEDSPMAKTLGTPFAKAGELLKSGADEAKSAAKDPREAMGHAANSASSLAQNAMSKCESAFKSAKDSLAAQKEVPEAAEVQNPLQSTKP